MPKCLVKGCKKDARKRGLCVADFDITRELIRDNLATDQQLVQAGRLLPALTPAEARAQEARRFFLAGLPRPVQPPPTEGNL